MIKLKISRVLSVICLHGLSNVVGIADAKIDCMYGFVSGCAI